MWSESGRTAEEFAQGKGFTGRLLRGWAGEFKRRSRRTPTVIARGVQVFLALETIDLRGSFDRPDGAALEQVGYDARGGALFVFFGKRKSAIKVLFFLAAGCASSTSVSERAPSACRRHHARAQGTSE